MSYTAAVLTVSDRGFRGERRDESGPAVRAILEEAGWEVVHTAILPDEREEIRADEEFLTKAEAGEVCFVEDRPIAPYAEQIEAMVLYDWDRAYPADVHLDFDPVEAGFTLAEEREFPGTSHERIIRKIYVREADHGQEERE